MGNSLGTSPARGLRIHRCRLYAAARHPSPRRTRPPRGHVSRTLPRRRRPRWGDRRRRPPACPSQRRRKENPIPTRPVPSPRAPRALRLRRSLRPGPGGAWVAAEAPGGAPAAQRPPRTGRRGVRQSRRRRAPTRSGWGASPPERAGTARRTQPRLRPRAAGARSQRRARSAGGRRLDGRRSGDLARPARRGSGHGRAERHEGAPLRSEHRRGLSSLRV